MTDNVIRDILIHAREESFRMQHFYIGVEHLFIGMLELHGGITRGLLEESGFTPDYVINALRAYLGKGTKQRLWAGMPNTPRADIVLGIANDLALEDGRQQISERDLLLAILEEHDSVPVRILQRLNIDLGTLRETARSRPGAPEGQPAGTQIEYSPDFYGAPPTEDEQIILRRMFRSVPRIRLDRRLTGGYSEASLFVVTPLYGDDEQAPVVVKIGESDAILDEARRYDEHVKETLPALAARLEDRPTTSKMSSLAGLKYTFISSEGLPADDLRAAAERLGGQAMGSWMQRSLFPTFGRTWWKQRRPYRFPAYAEYDWLLPPLLTLDYVTDEEIPANAILLRDPIRRSRVRALEYGETVVAEGFTVRKVNRHDGSLRLVIGRGSEAARRAHEIEIRGLNFSKDVYFRGEVIERIAGRLWKTRADLLLGALLPLRPDFDPLAPTMPGFGSIPLLPNPIIAHDDLLGRSVTGSISRLHGDLHLGNILVGAGGAPFLIDFAHARSGHTLFDWACLEVSLIASLIAPHVREEWEALRPAVHLLATVHQGHDAPPAGMLGEGLDALHALQEIIDSCLAIKGRRGEYYIALAFCALRGILWQTLPVGARRMLLLVSGYAVHEANRDRSAQLADQPSDDATDLL